MAETEIIYPRFFRTESEAASNSSKMRIPPSIMNHFGNDLPKKLKFLLPTGWGVSVKYKHEKEKMYGVNQFFTGAPLGRIGCSVFNYCGNGVFIVYCFSENFREVEYPSAEGHAFLQDKVNGVGWKFLYASESISGCDKGLVTIPEEFVTKFGHLIPSEINLTLPNGQIFEASYSNIDGTIRGFRVFQKHDLLMFTYCGGGFFNVVLFAQNAVEKSFAHTVPRKGAMLGIVHGQFKIEIRRFHLYKYCHGIDISSEFKSCTEAWTTGQILIVKRKGKYYVLEVRLHDNRRWKIHAGWVEFAKLLKLSVGDVLVFDIGRPPLGCDLKIYRSKYRK